MNTYTIIFILKLVLVENVDFQVLHISRFQGRKFRIVFKERKLNKKFNYPISVGVFNISAIWKDI